MSNKQELLDKISTLSARIGVIGLGYVGLPLAVEFATAGFRATGFEVDERKVQTINRGASYIPDVPSSQVAEMVDGRSTTSDDRFQGARRGRYHHHLRADAAAQNQRTRRLLYPLGRRKDPGCPPPRTAGDPRIDDLSRNDRRSAAPDVRRGRPEDRRRLFSRLLSRTDRSGQR